MKETLAKIDHYRRLGVTAVPVIALDEPVHLVIDDAHRAGDALAEGLLGALIASGSERLRLIFVGTGGLDARLSRWIAGVPDALIGDDRLAFDADEVARVLTDGDGREAPDAQAVFASTRGWPIAVQFIRFAGRAGRDGDGMGVEAFLRDYVRDNVFRDVRDGVASWLGDRSSSLSP